MGRSLTPIYTVAETRALEAKAMAAAPNVSLMQKAGAAAAAHAKTLLGDSGKRILILAGPGNNGGDALEVAVLLKQQFLQVSCVFTGDTARLPVDAALALGKWRAAGGELLAEIPSARKWDLVVDGLFGIGLTRAPTGRFAELIDQANAIDARKLALDMPSGINADTGEAPGTTFRATDTITFIALKPGLLTLDGPDHCGALTCAPLDLESERLIEPHGRLADEAVLDELPAPRPRNFHKGMAGTVAVIGGTTGMVGAVILAGRAALKLGAGKVFLGLLSEQPPQIDYQHPELMIRRADNVLAGAESDVVAIGPGMGTDANAQRILSQVLRLEVPLVLDADALNLIASVSVLRTGVLGRSAPTILTPHPAEAARLLELKTAAIQADRVQAACELARRFKAQVVLKGNGSLIATPDGRWWISASGNPGMASGGMGDALTGIIASLIAQGMEPESALRTGVFVHGAAADRAVAQGAGPAGLTASELIDAARSIINNRPSSI